MEISNEGGNRWLRNQLPLALVSFKSLEAPFLSIELKTSGCNFSAHAIKKKHFYLISIEISGTTKVSRLVTF